MKWIGGFAFDSLKLQALIKYALNAFFSEKVELYFVKGAKRNNCQII